VDRSWKRKGEGRGEDGSRGGKEREEEEERGGGGGEEETRQQQYNTTLEKTVSFSFLEAELLSLM